MNYDLKFKSDMFALNGPIRTYNFINVFESLLNPSIVTEEWTVNKHKNIFARMIDWFKRVITIHIPAFFKNLINIKISKPVELRLKTLISSVYENEWSRLNSFLGTLEDPAYDKFKQGDIDLMREQTVDHIKSFGEEEIKYIDTHINPRINDEREFIKLNSGFEKKIKLINTKIKNIIEEYKKYDGINELFIVCQDSYNVTMSAFRMMVETGSIKNWKNNFNTNESNISEIDAFKEFKNNSYRMEEMIEAMYQLGEGHMRNKENIFFEWKCRIDGMPESPILKSWWSKYTMDYKTWSEKIYRQKAYHISHEWMLMDKSIKRDDKKTIKWDSAKTEFSYVYCGNILPEEGEKLFIISPCWTIDNHILEKGRVIKYKT